MGNKPSPTSSTSSSNSKASNVRSSSKKLTKRKGDMANEAAITKRQQKCEKSTSVKRDDLNQPTEEFETSCAPIKQSVSRKVHLNQSWHQQTSFTSTRTVRKKERVKQRSYKKLFNHVHRGSS